jgi:pentatricopeptide repeat protein
MVLKGLNLARLSLAKTFTHGYAQSAVAASQSSYAAQNNTFGHFGSSFAGRFNNKSGTVYPQTQFAPTSNQHERAVKPQSEHADSGLAAYFAAWQKHQRNEGKEWQQFQFTKRIEWKPLINPAEGKPRAKEDTAIADDVTDPIPLHDGLTRSYSTSAVEDFRKVVGDGEAQAAALESVDDAIAEELAKARTEGDTKIQSISSGEGVFEVSEPSQSFTESVSERSTTPPSSVSEIDQYSAHLEQLVNSQQYAEIPAVFEALLRSGFKPSAASYNALLLAAVRLPRAKHQVVPKALDVYSDMLRRRVKPNTATYSLLLEILSGRALEVVAMRQALEEKRARFGGLEEPGKFMLGANEAEYDILAEDDSVDIAIKIFDAATSNASKRDFSQKTFHILVAACAEAGRVDDMVRIFSYMESQNVLPRADLFVPMIHAFGKSGDLRSVVECYDGYKALAIANDNGEITLSRKDNDVYAAVIKAYVICNRAEGAFKFLERIEETLPEIEQITRLRDVAGLKALIPQWLHTGNLENAVFFGDNYLSEQARPIASAAICIRAADLNETKIATAAFNALPETMDLAVPAMAMNAMHIRNGNLESAERFWKILETSKANPQFIESTAMQTIALIGSGQALPGLRQSRQMFARIRDSQTSSKAIKINAIEQIDEAIDVIGSFMVKRGIVLAPQPSMELMWTMAENGGIVPAVAGHLLAGLGPEAIGQLGWQDVLFLMNVQAGMITNSSRMDIANVARFEYLLDVVGKSGFEIGASTLSQIEDALAKLNRPELSQRWDALRHPEKYTQFARYVPPTAPVTPITPITAPSSFEDTYDPYASTTDNKGSVAITELLEKNHGKASSHLNEALTKFKNMRRTGRHPRFFTYAKLISAAAKENRLNLAHEILELAKQDVPLLPQYRIVRYGWVTILDAMVAACLTAGKRAQAEKYHQDLLELGAAPSANTFGLYITTLKESTKTFDEATEAVNIFLRAKAEGVEPSSFLYNALIGKLGKARRIDDCMFYFAEMRNLGIRPTSVTYGTIVNALCRVSDEKFAEELFEEMESMPNYKPRPAPYHSLMQFFLSTKRDRSKVLSYYERMRSKHIQPTSHTYKLLIDAHATLEPVNMEAAEAVLHQIRAEGGQAESVHYASLIHAKGCVQHDITGARKLFDQVVKQHPMALQPCLYQALFEAMVANHEIEDTDAILKDMKARGVEMTPYIANSLIHGWALAKNIEKAKAIYDSVPLDKREPSTYEAMTRAFMTVEDRANAVQVVNEGLSRGYPSAVAGKILELVGGGRPAHSSFDTSV